MVIYMYIVPGQQEKTTPWGSNCFHNHSVNLVICCKFLPSNEFVTSFPIQIHRVIIYINFEELKTPMLHAKFQDHRNICSGEEDF